MAVEAFEIKEETEILNFLGQRFGAEVFTPGLERTRPMYLPFIEYFKARGVKIVIIAGTNGKGQTTHTLASFLSVKNKNSAVWTSPHILSIKERFNFTIDGKSQEIRYKELIMAMHECDELLKVTMGSTKVSFYEFLFLVFLSLAKKQEKLDYLLLEVGLGGRLDAVNHFDADCACITSISRDHQSILGTRFDQILSEKIAVSRGQKPLFTNFSLEYLNHLTEKYVRSHNVEWHKLSPINDYFLANQMLAWEVFSFLEPLNGLDFETIKSQIPLYKGRREIMTFEGKSLIFIGAHNIDGVRKMLQSYSELELSSLPEGLLVSFSSRPVNEVEVMLKSMVDFFQDKAELKVTVFSHPKAIDAEDLKRVILRVNKGMLNFVCDWKSELRNSKHKTILVCGSYYFIGEVQRFINS